MRRVELMRTNEEYQPVSRCFFSCWPLYLEQLHATDNWTNKVDIKDGIDIYKVKDHGYGHEPKATDTRHGEALW